VKTLLFSAALLAILYTPTTLGAADCRKESCSWEAGQVLDSATARSRELASSTTVNSGDASHTSFEYSTLKESALVIWGKQYAYVIYDRHFSFSNIRPGSLIKTALTNRQHGCRFIVNDSVRYAQDRGNLWIVDVDHKVCKLEIDKQVHLQPTPAKAPENEY
jgi:hypothetical protein